MRTIVKALEGSPSRFAGISDRGDWPPAQLHLRDLEIESYGNIKRKPNQKIEIAYSITSGWLYKSTWIKRCEAQKWIGIDIAFIAIS